MSKNQTEQWQEVESVLDCFEQAWQRGERPCLDTFLPIGAVDGGAILAELCLIELELRLKAGEPARAEDYLKRYPALVEDHAALRNLIATEYAWRRRHEPDLGLAEYQRRFPMLDDASLDRLKEATPVPNVSVPGYEVLSSLGRGGMGVVYKARHLRLRRLVALKMVLAVHAEPKETAHLHREAEAIARLQHPNIVQVFEVGEHAGQPYLAMEYVEGVSLAKYCSGKPIAPRLACELVQTLARAIHFAHQHGIIHRDLKPANILLARSNKLPTGSHDPKITDFGLAKQMDGGPGVTQSGMVVGTPAYLAPEQAAGKNRDVGAWTDTYALGAILYELITGKPPFRGENVMDTLQRVLTEEAAAPQAPTGYCKVPADVQTICLKCLQKEPARRYPSAEALADDLRRFLNNEPILARPVSWFERGVKWTRRRPAVASLLGVILAAILTGMLGIVSHTASLQESLGNARRAQEEAENARKKSQVQEKQQRQYLYAADVKQAAQFWKIGDVKQARNRLGLYLPTSENTEDVRGFEWHYLWRLLHSSEKQTLCEDGREIDRAHFSQDGRILVLSDSKGALTLWNTATGTLIARVPAGPAPLVGLGFSRDGEVLATANSLGTISLYSANTGQERSTVTGFASPVQELAFAPDLQRGAFGYSRKSAELQEFHGKKNAGVKISVEPATVLTFSPGGGVLATGSDRGWCFLRNGLTGQGQGSTLLAAFEITALAINPQEDVVAIGCADGSVRFWMSRLGFWEALGKQFGPVRCLAFSPDGESLASGSDDANVIWWNVRGRHKRFTFKGHREPVLAVAFASDARTLFSASRDGIVKRWQPASEPDREQVPASFWPSGAVAYSPNGKILAIADRDGSIKLAEADTGRVQTSLYGHVGTIHGLAFSDDGQMLASAGVDHTCRLWTLPRSGLLAEAKELLCHLHPSPVKGVAISPNGGRFLASYYGRVVRLWDLKAGKIHTHLAAPAGVIQGMDFANAQTLVTGSSDGMVLIWDVLTGTQRTLSSAGPAVRAVRFTQDGRRVAVSRVNNTIQLLDVAGSQPLADLGWLPGSAVALAFSPDDKVLIAGLDKGQIDIWDAATRKLRQRLTVLTSESLVSLSLARDGNSLATGCQGGVQLWDLSRLTYRTPIGQPPRAVRALAFSPDGGTLVTASDQASIPSGGSQPLSRTRIFGPGKFSNEQATPKDAEDLQFWDVASRSKLDRLEGQPGMGLLTLAQGQNRRTLATGGIGGTVWLWDLQDRKLQRSLFISLQAQTYWQKWEVLNSWGISMCPEFENVTWKIALSPDGRLLAAASEKGAVKMWDVASGEEGITLGLSHRSYPDLAFALDGETLATSDAGEVHFWNTSTGKLQRTLPCHRDAIRCVSFSPNGSLLATAGKDREIRLWDWKTGQKKGSLIGHHDTVVSLAFTPDGKTLASGSWDGTARLWHLFSGQELLALEGHNGKVHSVAFSPDGKTLATGGESTGAGGEVFLWQGQ